ncbi:LysR family transcriptional regulator [Vagococcus elongatus]|uniref:HTH lysR-type domain-containing protein n=1 Tax=Vagococcus elongatus TaxID=180344 RepID=A0A430B5N0_9ENTE|nr:LysR family transcriptional regulator [Vagococcus elongatus]RSU15609.1 hypothetical protein CBF29_00605 [Vagococcus elongatus]
MEIRTLETFQVVAQELNMTKAAQKLNYSQPTISKHIQSLENEIGTTLLEKKGGKYFLTLAGEELFKHSTNILREVNLLKKIHPEHGEKYKIRLQGHDYYLFNYFLPILKSVVAKFPTVSFQLDGTNNETAIQRIIRNEIDLGIVSGNIASSDLLYEKIGSEATALCISSEIYKESIDIEYYLEKYPIVIDNTEKYSYESFFLKSVSTPTIIHCSSDEVVQEAILNEKMIGIVRTGRLKKYIQSGEIKILKQLTKSEPIHIVMNANRLDNKYINQAFNAICYRFKKNQTTSRELAWKK